MSNPRPKLMRETKVSPRKFSENGKRAKQAANAETARRDSEITLLLKKGFWGLIAGLVFCVAAFPFILMNNFAVAFLLLVASFLARCYYWHTSNQINDLRNN